MRLNLKHLFWLKIVLHLAALLPLLWLVYAVSQGDFSANPAKDIQHFTGRMALKLLLASLLTPLARYARQPLLVRCRRLLGLLCFAWAMLHLASYTLLELGIDNLRLLSRELVTRPYLVLGITNWVILLLLVGTSILWAQRKLKNRWQILHNLIYIVAILAPIYYLWSVKIFSLQPVCIPWRRWCPWLYAIRNFTNGGGERSIFTSVIVTSRVILLPPETDR